MDSGKNLFKVNYCDLCQVKVADRREHVHSIGHILHLVDPANSQRVKDYLSNMQRPLVY